MTPYMGMASVGFFGGLTGAWYGAISLLSSPVCKKARCIMKEGEWLCLEVDYYTSRGHYEGRGVFELASANKAYQKTWATVMSILFEAHEGLRSGEYDYLVVRMSEKTIMEFLQSEQETYQRTLRKKGVDRWSYLWQQNEGV